LFESKLILGAKHFNGLYSDLLPALISNIRLINTTVEKAKVFVDYTHFQPRLMFESKLILGAKHFNGLYSDRLPALISNIRLINNTV